MRIPLLKSQAGASKDNIIGMALSRITSEGKTSAMSPKEKCFHMIKLELQIQ